MKKFYSLVSHRREGEGYSILLDGRPVKTPARNMLIAPGEKLADEIVREWAAQEGEIIPDTMPVTQILTTRQERVSKERAAMQEAVLKYLDTDLLCYTASEPPGLVEMQEARWAPLRTLFEKRFDATLLTTTGLAALAQDEAVHARVRQVVSNMDDDRFTVLQLVTAACGSLILALCFVENEVTPEEAIAAALVEEDFKNALYNAKKYGADPMEEKSRFSMLRDLAASRTYLDCL